MQYRTLGKTGDRVSALGFGVMRLPERRRRIDERRAARLIHDAIDAGVNYLDTAWSYHRGQSETFLGKILLDGRRDRVRLATKLPHWLVREPDDLPKLFGLQLERLRTDWIDYYLIHNVSLPRWQMLKSLGIVEFLEAARADGRIQHLGFSSHVGRDEFKRLVDDYDWEFCQIQYNYLDTEHQAGREGLLHAAARGLGIVIMEPLRGGALANKPPAKVQQVWDQADMRRTPAEWALRWLWDQPEIHVVLSGMSTEQQLRENLHTADTAEANTLTDEERALVDQVATEFRALMRAGCTGCQYCLPCPAGVNIPGCLHSLDAASLDDRSGSFNRLLYLINIGGLAGAGPGLASKCTQCGHCREACPQHLPIPELLEQTRREFETLPARLLLKLSGPIMRLARRSAVRRARRSGRT